MTTEGIFMEQFTPFLPLLGTLLPLLQNVMNQWFNKDRKIIGLIIKAEEQRFLFSCLLSLIAGIILSVMVYGTDLQTIAFHSAEIFVASQVAYRLFFKKVL